MDLTGHRKLVAFSLVACAITTLILLGKGESSGVEAIVWAFGVFVTGNVGSAWSGRGGTK